MGKEFRRWVAALVVSTTLDHCLDLEARWRGRAESRNYDSAGHYWTMTPINTLSSFFKKTSRLITISERTRKR